jgi:hypothetical protein
MENSMTKIEVLCFVFVDVSETRRLRVAKRQFISAG